MLPVSRSQPSLTCIFDALCTTQPGDWLDPAHLPSNIDNLYQARHFGQHWDHCWKPIIPSTISEDYYHQTQTTCTRQNIRTIAEDHLYQVPFLRTISIKHRQLHISGFKAKSQRRIRGKWMTLHRVLCPPAEPACLRYWDGNVYVVSNSRVCAIPEVQNRKGLREV